MEWLEKLSKAVDYIEEHLDGKISYAEAAEIACCSVFYFQRIFSYVAGISLSEYIRRRRMTQAAFELQRTRGKVIDIALKYGYASPTAFNRAFQSVHHIPPAAARNPGCTLNAYPAIHFSVQVTGERPMTYHIASKGPLRLAGIRVPLTGDMEENQRIIPQFWERFWKEVRQGRLNSLLSGQCKLRLSDRALADPGLPGHGQSDSNSLGHGLSSPNSPGPDLSFPNLPDSGLPASCLSHPGSREILGVSVYEGPGKIFYYIAAVTEGPVPSGLYTLEIPAAAWAIFENEGGFKADVQDVFRRFYREWLPFSGYEYAGLPDIEVYPLYPICEEIPANGHSQVWIAIKKNREDKP